MRVASKVGNFPSEFRHAKPLGSRIICYVRDGRTDGRTKATFIAPYPTVEGIITNNDEKKFDEVQLVSTTSVLERNETTCTAMTLLWAPAQRKRATMLYFANVFFIYFSLLPPYSPALVNGGSRKFYTW